MTNPRPKAVVLLSGGIDSATTLALAQRQGFEVYALTFRYGQRHQLEVEAARRIAGALRAAHMADLATKAGVEGRQRLHIHTPLIALSKQQIIQTGFSLGVDYALTSSCYDPSPTGEACGRCDACLLRLKGFAEAGARDPIRYRHEERAAR